MHGTMNINKMLILVLKWEIPVVYSNYKI